MDCRLFPFTYNPLNLPVEQRTILIQKLELNQRQAQETISQLNRDYQIGEEDGADIADVTTHFERVKILRLDPVENDKER